METHFHEGVQFETVQVVRCFQILLSAVRPLTRLDLRYETSDLNLCGILSHSARFAKFVTDVVGKRKLPNSAGVTKPR